MSSFVNTLTLKDPDFPEELTHTKPAVKQLYWVGKDPASWLKLPKIAIVGSRLVSPYGRLTTEKLASELARAGVVVISGLALGIDSIAHEACIRAGGTTVAVMPGGLDRIYPASHRNLALQIIKSGGSLISEYPEQTTIYKYNFVARNRIISGVADALVITEAALKSGTIHTAKFALEQGKTVMAVPGNINSKNSEGCNNLIKSGALPVTEVGDILFAIGYRPSKAKSQKQVFAGSKDEAKVTQLIGEGIADQEEIALRSQLGPAKLAGILTMLEINGIIRPGSNGKWFLA